MEDQHFAAWIPGCSDVCLEPCQESCQNRVSIVPCFCIASKMMLEFDDYDDDDDDVDNADDGDRDCDGDDVSAPVRLNPLESR